MNCDQAKVSRFLENVVSFKEFCVQWAICIRKERGKGTDFAKSRKGCSFAQAITSKGTSKGLNHFSALVENEKALLPMLATLG